MPVDSAGNPTNLFGDSKNVRGFCWCECVCIPAEYTKNIGRSTNILLEVQQNPRASKESLWKPADAQRVHTKTPITGKQMYPPAPCN
jgi:hypothetical protein